jgi:hypothetical protein
MAGPGNHPQRQILGMAAGPGQQFRRQHPVSRLLRARLQNEQPGRAGQLHRNAAVWYEEHGLADDAIGHAVAAGEMTWAARGARGGILTIRTPSLARTSSNALVNVASRSRMRNPNRPIRSGRSMTRLRAYWAVHTPSGYRVTPRMCTRGVATSVTNNTYKRLRKIVSTVKKSNASGPSAWARRNLRQEYPGRAEQAGTARPARSAAHWPH